MASPGGKDLFDIGDLVNNTYRIEDVLGRGGMGAVYLARHAVTEDQVAIKVLRAEHTNNEMQRELMIRERSVRAVQHPAVIGYQELGLTAGSDIYLVMDYVKGKPVEALMKERRFTPEETLELGLNVARGLAACHEKNVIHRDMSPDNVLLRDGRVDQPVIIDFGIAKNESTGETIIGSQFAGKYTYAPPEQFQGQVDARSDLYALGMTLLAVIRGTAPSFGSNDFEIVTNKQKPLDLSDVPEPLGSLLARLTHPDPAERPSTAEDAIRLFEAAQAGASLPQDPTTGTIPDGTVIASMPAAAPTMTPQSTGDILDDLGGTRIGAAPPSLPPSAPPATQAWPPPPPTAAPPPSPQARRETRPPEPARRPEPRSRAPEPEPEPESGSSGGLVAAILVLAVIGAGGIGAYLSGMLDEFLGPSLETKTPYRFEVALDQRGTVDVAGYLPSEEAASAIAGYLASEYAAERARMTLPTFAGAPTPGFPADMEALLRALEPLEDFALRLEDAAGSVTGLAEDRRIAQSVSEAVEQIAARGGYEIGTDIAVGPRWLAPDDLLGPIAQAGGCGPLAIAPPIGERFTLGETITVTGSVTDEAARGRVRAELESRAGDRPLDLTGLEPINRPVCIVRELLPSEAGAEHIEIAFAYGSEEEERVNEDGAYAVGENPLIDVVLPVGNDWGHLHVAAVDVTGAVFHMLPNQCTPETQVINLGSLEQGQRTIRVAHHTAEREQDACVIAFTVDETFGKTLVLAFHTEVPLFDELRPISESAESFAEALRARAAQAPLDGGEFTTRYIVSRKE